MSDDLVWRTARDRVLAAFDRQYAKGVATYGVPLQPTVDGLDLAEEALSELVDAAVYLQAVATERDGLRAEVARLKAEESRYSGAIVVAQRFIANAILDYDAYDEPTRQQLWRELDECISVALGTGGSDAP